jgi:hypothetical protein
MSRPPNPRCSGLHEVAGVLLEEQQAELLRALVEAHRQVMPRHDFIVFHVANADPRAFVRHAGLPEVLRAAEGDLDVLTRQGFLLVRSVNKGVSVFTMSPQALAYYESLQRQGEPAERIEQTIRRLLDGESFKSRFPVAHAKWVQAEELLWAADAQEQLTAIGHHCREAAQAFATALVSQYQPPSCDPDPTKTKNRLRAVVEARRPALGEKAHDLLTAMVDYWGALVELHQRQTHGAQREGQPLTWEDGRRVVFQTLLVMYELDRALSPRA